MSRPRSPRESTQFRLNRAAQQWLRSPGPGEAPRADHRDDPGDDWSDWILGRMAAAALLDVDGILVDQAILEQRVACVPQRCAPQPGRGRMRSCCADLDVALTGDEINRLRRHTRRLWSWLSGREPRLRELVPNDAGRPFWLADDRAHLSHPGSRCVFSALDDKGRIRCHLHAYAREHDVQRQTVQPLPCRLFPLILVELPAGGVLLTTLCESTAGLLGTFPASRFPCLSDPSHRLAVKSLAEDLDWLFGRGFARTLRSSGT